MHAKRESGDAKERGDAREVWQLEQLLGRRRHPETRDPARRDDEQAKCDHGEANAGDDGQAGEVAQQRQRHEAPATQQYQHTVAVEWQSKWQRHARHDFLNQVGCRHLHRGTYAGEQQADRRVEQEHAAVTERCVCDR